MSKRGKYAIVTLGGCLMGLAVVLVVVLTSPDRQASGNEVAALAVGAAFLGGAMTFVRYYAKDRAQSAGRALRDRHDRERPNE